MLHKHRQIRVLLVAQLSLTYRSRCIHKMWKHMLRLHCLGVRPWGKWCIKHCLTFLPWSPIKSNLSYCTSNGIFLSVFILYIFFQSPTFIFHVIFCIAATKTNNRLSCISLILCALKSLWNEIPFLLCSYLPRLNIPICHPSKLSTFYCQQSLHPFRPSVPEGFSLWPDSIFRSANQKHAPHLLSRSF